MQSSSNAYSIPSLNINTRSHLQTHCKSSQTSHYHIKYLKQALKVCPDNVLKIHSKEVL